MTFLKLSQVILQFLFFGLKMTFVDELEQDLSYPQAPVDEVHDVFVPEEPNPHIPEPPEVQVPPILNLTLPEPDSDSSYDSSEDNDDDLSYEAYDFPDDYEMTDAIAYLVDEEESNYPGEAEYLAAIQLIDEVLEDYQNVSDQSDEDFVQLIGDEYFDDNEDLAANQVIDEAVEEDYVQLIGEGFFDNTEYLAANQLIDEMLSSQNLCEQAEEDFVQLIGDEFFDD